MALVNHTAALLRAIARAWRHKIGYSVVTLLIFFVSVSVLATFDLLPERKTTVALTASVAEAVVAQPIVVPELPVSIEIARIGLKTAVANPTRTDVPTLDAALHDGAVRYPTSAKLGADGNVILFGHSSYLPVINNPAFKAFNEIQKLTKEDRIVVKGETTTFVYQVESVNSADAGVDGIPLTVEGKMLTLATCDSFGTKSDRFIVTARFVESYPNAS
jgi:LPXTG-site transpeptidase (sortase) family protein